MPDDLHVQIVDEALSKGNREQDVQMTFGELMLFQVLLQNYGIDYVGEDRFIPLMQRNAARVQSVENP